MHTAYERGDVHVGHRGAGVGMGGSKEGLGRDESGLFVFFVVRIPGPCKKKAKDSYPFAAFVTRKKEGPAGWEVENLLSKNVRGYRDALEVRTGMLVA